MLRVWKHAIYPIFTYTKLGKKHTKQEESTIDLRHCLSQTLNVEQRVFFDMGKKLLLQLFVHFGFSLFWGTQCYDLLNDLFANDDNNSKAA